MESSARFRAKGIGKKTEDGSWLFRNVDLEVDNGVLTITGPSGVGKSTLLKCINQTITMDEGQVWLHDKTPDQWGIPTWRSKVMYIPQRTAIMEGTPLDFVEEVRKFGAHKKNAHSYDDPVQIALDWGIRPDLWHSRWSNLSGGEMQRISLAIGCSFRPEVLLLDEPTSALDEESCSKVEKTLGQINCVWVTHNPQQAKRISSAGTLVMRGGDNSEYHGPSGVVVEEDGVHGHGHGGAETRSSSNTAHTTTTTITTTTTASSSSKNTHVNGAH
ncbi:P-loop containing nucleoside triphosphate hydrolase protein [Dissophora ornata]|nr:hypothetical protein BGZ58_005206 [Dissophora ornata]KAI8603706.1 P-loop containing nucleoside triphosphate hydrolase protein [Dissophora ornata]